MLEYLFLILLFFTAVFLILLILIQRGKGGGLAGAFGGMGGQSAFGTKAGDAFTRFTIGVAAVWILLCILSGPLLSTSQERVRVGSDGDATEQGADTESSTGDLPSSGSPDDPDGG